MYRYLLALVLGTTITVAAASESSPTPFGEGMQCVGVNTGQFFVCGTPGGMLYCLEVGHKNADKLGYRCTRDVELFVAARKLQIEDDYVTGLQKKRPYGPKRLKEFNF